MICVNRKKKQVHTWMGLYNFPLFSQNIFLYLAIFVMAAQCISHYRLIHFLAAHTNTYTHPFTLFLRPSKQAYIYIQTQTHTFLRPQRYSSLAGVPDLPIASATQTLHDAH